MFGGRAHGIWFADISTRLTFLYGSRLTTWAWWNGRTRRRLACAAAARSGRLL